MADTRRVIVSGSFDDLRSRQVRLLQEAARLGPVTVLLWSDEALSRLGASATFPQEERHYLLRAVRYAYDVTLVHDPDSADVLAGLAGPAGMWVVDGASERPAWPTLAQEHGLAYRVLGDDDLAGFPPDEREPLVSSRAQVMVTGCYDWLHSGHVRFFEEATEYGDLIVVVGHDANVRLLKGEGHPLFSQDERRYMVAAIRHVAQALISSGHGWMDAEPEIARVQPDIYLVNEDGDKPEKRAFCRERGIEYVVLRRLPKEGLPRRESKELRGF